MHCAAAPDTKSELDFLPASAGRAAFTAADIRLPFGMDISSEYGSLGLRTIAQDPFLATLPHPGASAAVVDLEPCGVVAPHVHPRGSEFLVVTKGQVRPADFRSFRPAPWRRA
jgi:Cupin